MEDTIKKTAKLNIFIGTLFVFTLLNPLQSVYNKFYAAYLNALLKDLSHLSIYYSALIIQYIILAIIVYFFFKKLRIYEYVRKNNISIKLFFIGNIIKFISLVLTYFALTNVGYSQYIGRTVANIYFYSNFYVTTFIDILLFIAFIKLLYDIEPQRANGELKNA